jgi:CubicO group peptidase (beta-lactamase class C family)
VRGDEVRVVVSGVRDVRTGAPVTEETRFEGGSLTKMMAATLALRVADRRVHRVEAGLGGGRGGTGS